MISKMNGEKGSARIFWALLVVLGVLGLWLGWAWRGRLGHLPPGPSPKPTVVSYKEDPAGATQALLNALNKELESLDLLKLLDREVETFPVTLQGRAFEGYRETFRLPLRYSPVGIARVLERTARSQGAALAEGRTDNLLCFTLGPGGETCVQIALVMPLSPRVCLIIDDGGYQKGGTLQTLYSFKVPVTVAIIPGAEFSKALAGEFPDHGVEVMCHMPMEGHETGSVGQDYPELLKKGMGSSEARKEVREALADLPNCRGLNNHMGSVATEDPELMWDVCEVLKPLGLFIIDSRTTAKSTVEPVARKAGVPVAHRDVFLDNVEEPGAILEQWGQLIARAKRKGLAVGIGHFKGVTLKTLAEAIPAAREQGIQFVFASEVVK